ncbi:MAG: hypothetical protein ACFE8U_13520, partial [Candidatus Hermodarchaeota archaeon]
FHLLLLPIFLFQDFTIFPDRIVFHSKTAFQPEIYRYLISSLNILVGHQFYIKYDEDNNIIELFCLDNPQFFQRFSQE